MEKLQLASVICGDIQCLCEWLTVDRCAGTIDLGSVVICSGIALL